MFDAGASRCGSSPKPQTGTMPVRGRWAGWFRAGADPAAKCACPSSPASDDLARARCLIRRARGAGPTHSRGDFGKLRDLTRECEAAFTGNDPDKPHRTSELNHAFHFYIYRAAGSAVLIPVVESLWLQSGPYVRAAAQIHDELRDMSGTHHHWALIEALERGDRAQAVKALKNDITRSFNLVRRKLADAGNGEEARAYG